MRCIILSHLFVRDTEEYKLDQIDLTIKHYRKYNKDVYIIATGHGLYPKSIESYCDYIYWPEKIIESEIGVGHPYLVNKALDHAIDKGFEYVMKCRTDGVILRENIIDFCIDRLKDKQLLLTQQTRFVPTYAGDLFMYGKTDVLKKCWNIETWYPTITGLSSFANNILKVYNYDDWKLCLLNNVEFVDIFNIKWIDFRGNWDKLKDIKNNIMDNNVNDYEQYLWGSREGWHVFNKNGELVHGQILTEKEFYENRDLLIRSRKNI